MPPPSANPPADRWERKALFIFGVVFLIALLAGVYFASQLSRQQWYVLLWALGLAAGAIAALLPGSVEWKINAGLKVTGAIAVTAMVIWLGRSYAPENAQATPGTLKASMSFERCATAPGDIAKTDVYVVVNGKLVWADRRAGGSSFTPVASDLKCGTAQRGPGGITIDCSPVSPGAVFMLFVRGFDSKTKQERWWRTYDLEVPALYAAMDDGSKEDLQAFVTPQ
jgi:hypothetical protein